MSTSRRGFFGRLFGGAVVAAVPSSWYLRQGLQVPPGPMPALPGWTPIEVHKPSAGYPAEHCAAVMERLDRHIAARRAMVWRDRIVPYNPAVWKELA